MAFDFDRLMSQAKEKDAAARKSGLQSKTAYKPTVNDLPVVSTPKSTTGTGSWVSTGAGRKSTVGNLDDALARLEAARKKAAYIDNDDAAVLDINRQMKELRAQFGQQTAGDRAWDISSAIVNPVLGSTVNTAGTVVNVFNDADHIQNDIDRIKSTLAAGKTTDGKTLTDVQRQSLETRVKELETDLAKSQSEDALHNKIYDWADERTQMGMEAQESAKAGLNKAGQTLVDAGVSFGQSMIAGAIGAATGTGMAAFGVQAFGGSAQQARWQGKTASEALMYGGAQAAKEIIAEKIFGLAVPQKLAGVSGSADEAIERGIRKAVDRIAKQFGTGEVGQRVLGGLATWLMSGATEGLEEGFGAFIEEALINPMFDQEAAARPTDEKVADALYGMLLGGVSGLFGITNAFTYETTAHKQNPYKVAKTAAVTSPAAAPEVQQLSEQAEVTQELNPNSKVLDAATTLFMNEQGCNQKTAEFRASVVQKLVAGEEVDTKTLKRIDPTNKTTQRIFTQLTGVQFPTGPADMAAVLPIFRTAHEVAAQAKTQAQAQVEVQQAVAQAQQEAVDNAQPVADNIINETQEAGAVETSQAVPVVEAVTQGTIRMSNGGEITREQFIEYLRNERFPNATPEQLNAYFNQMKAYADKGNPMPYDKALDKYMREVGNTDGGQENQPAENGRPVQGAGESGEGTGRDDARRDGDDEVPAEDGGDESTPHGGQNKARLHPREGKYLGLSGLVNPRTQKVSVPGISGQVDAVVYDDYTDEMKRADRLAREIGINLTVTKKPFRTVLREGFSLCNGLMSYHGKYITVSAKETKRSDFYSTFLHELFHAFYEKKNFQTKFLTKVITYANIEGVTGRAEVNDFLRKTARKNRYLSGYKFGYAISGLTKEEVDFALVEELFAEVMSGNNRKLKLDQKLFDALQEAAEQAWYDVAPEYITNTRTAVKERREKMSHSDSTEMKEDANGREEERTAGAGRSVRTNREADERGPAGAGVRNESLHGRDYQRTGEPDGSVQEARRGTETSDGGGLGARDSVAREVRVGESEAVQSVAPGAVSQGERRVRAAEEAATEALNIGPEKADVPTFKSWNEAFLYFAQGKGKTTDMSFDEPPMLADEMVFGSGKPWQELKSYPKTEAGLKQFQADLESFLTSETKATSKPKVTGNAHLDSFAKKRKNAHKVTVEGHTYDAVSVRDYTGSMREIRNKAREVGFSIEFVYGDVKSKTTDKAEGVTMPGKRMILVSVDNEDYLKTARHEVFHAYTFSDHDLHKRILDRVKAEGMQDVLLTLLDDFADKWSNYDDALIDEWTFRYKIEDEVFAEAFAKSTAHSGLIRELIDIVKEEVDPWLVEWKDSKPDLNKELRHPSLETLVEWYGTELGGFSFDDFEDEYMSFADQYDDADFAYSMASKDDLLSYLDEMEKSFGYDTAQAMFDAFVELDRSRQAAKEMAEAQPSVGAADLGFDPYTNLANTYGTVEPGENPDKVIDMPAQTKPNNKVSLTPRTVMEAKATPESRIPTIEQAVVDHKFSYIAGINKIQVRRAEAKLRKEGWAETLTNWTRDVRDGKSNADLVALGAVMLQNAGNSDMSGARYVQLLVDYTDLARRSSQATQAARVLKNLTPEARLYGLHGYANRMNDRIRQDDPANNIPVEKWMEVTGNLLAERLKQAVGGSRKKARTTAQIILKDLNTFAREAFPEKEKAASRTEMDRLQDLFDNYDNYREAWEAAKETIRAEYADKPEALATFEKFLQTDLAEAFLGRYFKAPEVRIDGALAQEFLNAKTEEERDAVIDRIIEDIARQIPATKMEKFTALRYLNMLGNFKTQGRNLLGNAFNLGLTGMKNQVAALLEWAINLNGEKVERTKSFKKDKATYQAALKDFEKMQEIVLSGGKYQDGRRFDERIEEKRTIFKFKPLEGYRKATNWAMTQGDLVFSRIAYAEALAGYLSAHGKTFETAGEAMMEQARAYAVQQAAEATFRDSNMFSDAIAGMRFRNPDTPVKRGINAIGEGVLPFRKTPANILVRAVEYSPLGVLTTAAEAVYGKGKTGAVDASKVIDSLAKNITGTGLMVLGYFLANSNLLHGAAPDDDKEKEFEELTGHRAYSIELPNGMSLTLDWLAPSSIPLFLGVQIAESAAENGLTMKEALTAIGAITDPMLQMSMLQGLDDALSNASTYGDDSALVRFTGNALWSFMTQGLTNTMLGQLERSLKNERSTTYRDKNKDLPDGLQYLLGKTLEKVPLPRADYGQIPYIDAWGRIETNAKTDFGNVFTQFFSPSYVSWVNESDMEEELQRLHDATGEGSVLISRPKSYFNVDKDRKDLTAEEFVEYATTRGQVAYNVATDLTESKIYGTLTDKQKVAAVEKAYDFANQVAKATVTGYDPSKWDSDAPEGAVVPDKWVMDAMTDAAEYGIPVGEYTALYAATKDMESYKDKKGETVDNSKSLKLAVAIYDLGLSDAQTDKLMEDFGVNKTVRKYSEKMARRKLDAMKEKYE